MGVALALGLFCVLFMTLIRIARRATDSFSSLLVFGIWGCSSPMSSRTWE